MNFPKLPYPVKPLTEEERKISYSKYYDIPMNQILPPYRQILQCSPIPCGDAIPPERFLDLLDEDQGDASTGYCIYPDGTCYNSHYAYFPHLTMDMIAWWYQWLAVKTKGAPEGCGNLKYKIWCPPDHEDYGFTTDAQGRPCLFFVESHDMGGGAEPSTTYRYKLTGDDIGLSKEAQERLAERGCVYNYCNAYVERNGRGHWKMNANYTRPHPNGGIEMRQCNWIGWRYENGRPVRVEGGEPDDEALCFNMVHNTQEIERFSVILPDLYREYHEKPFDED